MSGSPGLRRCANASAVLALAAMSVPLSAVGSVAAAQAAAFTGVIAGRVVTGAERVGIAEARVQALALPARAAVASATTDANGRFRLAGLQAGEYALAVSRIGFRTEQLALVRVGVGAVATAPDVALTALATQLDPVVTTASRGRPEKALSAPASISVVTSEEVERRAPVTTADLVRNTPGVDATQGGVAQTNIVVRGFNNAFSGSLLMLQDYRFAGVPSLRVNVPLLTTGTSDDVERVEVLLGPASALYGPNSANGVLHVITKSPFNSAGTSVTLDGGQQSLFRGALRHATRVNDKVAFKLSGEYLTANDFAYADPAEPAQFPNSPLTPAARRGAANARDYDIRRFSGEARVDLRPGENSEAITTLGYTNVGRALELTGANGASQIRGWSYANIQQRFRYKRLFLQGFANLSDAGNADSLGTDGTFLLRSGQPIVDKSRVYSAQAQHGFEAGRLDFVYGADYIRTDPRTGGTINGRNEENDEVNEYGAYVQSTARLGPKVDLLGALRVDGNTVISGTQLSPRAALVFKPTGNHNFRATYNRAFSTPANFSYFLDLIRQPLGGPYNVRAVGNPPKQGVDYRRDCVPGVADGLCMRSPFTGSGAFVAAGGQPAYAAFIAALNANLPANNATLRPLLPALTALAAGAGAANLSEIRYPSAAGNAPVLPPSALQRIAPLEAQFNNTYELGYKGIVRDRFRLSTDFWYQQRSDVGTPAQLATPGVFLNRAALGAYVTANLPAVLQAAGQSPGVAAATATAVGQALAASPDLAALFRLPLGVVTFDSEVGSRPTDFLATYQNVNKRLNVYGTDVAADFLVDDRFTLAATYSFLSQNVFRDVLDPSTGVPFMSNSPRHRASLTGRLDNLTGFGFELRGRYADAFPVNSAVYVSGVNLALPGGTGTFQYPGVPVNMFVDAGVSYRVTLGGRRALLAINGTNVFDNSRASFVGTPQIGRLVITRVKVDF